MFSKGQTIPWTEKKAKYEPYFTDVCSDRHLRCGDGESPFQRRHDLHTLLVLWLLAELRGGWQQLCEVEPSDVASQITSPRLTERWKRDKTFSV